VAVAVAATAIQAAAALARAASAVRVAGGLAAVAGAEVVALPAEIPLMAGAAAFGGGWIVGGLLKQIWDYFNQGQVQTPVPYNRDDVSTWPQGTGGTVLRYDFNVYQDGQYQFYLSTSGGGPTVANEAASGAPNWVIRGPGGAYLGNIINGNKPTFRLMGTLTTSGPGTTQQPTTSTGNAVNRAPLAASAAPYLKPPSAPPARPVAPATVGSGPAANRAGDGAGVALAGAGVKAAGAGAGAAGGAVPVADGATRRWIAVSTVTAGSAATSAAAEIPAGWSWPGQRAIPAASGAPAVPLTPAGTPVTLPAPGTQTTPAWQEVVGGLVIGSPAAAPRATSEAIASELGRIEEKTAGLLGGLGYPEAFDGLMRLLQLLELEDRGVDYLLHQPCGTQPNGQPWPPYKVTVPASIGISTAVVNRLDALARMLDLSKSVRQPICRGRSIGEAVTVTFQRVE